MNLCLGLEPFDSWDVDVEVKGDVDSEDCKTSLFGKHGKGS